MAFDVGALTASLKLNDKQFTAGVKSASRRLKTLDTKMTAFGGKGVKAIRGVTNSLFGLKSAIAGVGIGLLARNFTGVASSMEVFEVQLQTTLGSLDKAKARMEWIEDFAKTTPFEIPQLVEASVRLEAYGIDAEKHMRTLGDTASAMGKPMIMAVEALADAQTGEFERLKEFGLKVVQDGGKDFVLYTDKFGQEQRKAIDRNNRAIVTSTLTSIWNEKYAGGMDRLSKTWSGMVSNLMDHWFQFRNAIMQSGLFEFMKSGLRTLLNYINDLKESGQLDVWAKNMGTSIINALVSVGSVVVKFPALWSKMVSGVKTALGYFVTIVDALVLAPIEGILKAWNALPFVKDTSLSEIKGLRSALQDTANDFFIQADNLDNSAEKWEAWGDRARQAIERVRAGVTGVKKEIASPDSTGVAGAGGRGGVSPPKWVPGADLSEMGKAKTDTFQDDGVGGLTEQALADYQSRNEMEAGLLEERIQAIANAYDMEQALAIENGQKLIAIQQAEITKRKQYTALLTSSIVDGVSYLRQAFPKLKGLAEGQATFNLGVALSEALKAPWPTSIVAWGKVLALGKTALDTVKGASPGSGGSVPSLGSAPIATVPQADSGAGAVGGTKEINFTINALDPSSVDPSNIASIIATALPEVLKSTSGVVGDVVVNYEER